MDVQCEKHESVMITVDPSTVTFAAVPKQKMRDQSGTASIMRSRMQNASQSDEKAMRSKAKPINANQK
jgi:hypothetical protein